MHPEMIRALGRQRQAELLRQRQGRQMMADSSPLPGSHGGAVGRVRRWLGSGLVVAGAWLLRGRPGTVDVFDTPSCSGSDSRMCRC